MASGVWKTARSTGAEEEETRWRGEARGWAVAAGSRRSTGGRETRWLWSPVELAPAAWAMEVKGGEVAVALQVAVLGIEEGHGGALVGGLDRVRSRGKRGQVGGGVQEDGWDKWPKN